jgi:hypothetical protein
VEFFHAVFKERETTVKRRAILMALALARTIRLLDIDFLT